MSLDLQFLRSSPDPIRDFGFYSRAVLLERPGHEARSHRWRLYWCHFGICVSQPECSMPLDASTETSCRAINVLAVKAYGEAEFWLSGGKVILIFLLFSFTFVTMVGGNPQNDAYGFRNWNNPGAFAEYLSSGALGRFEGFLACMWSAAFCVVGPEYISMVAAEAQRPRVYIKNAFKTVYWRFGLFFIMGALCAGIVIPYDDETLTKVQESGE